MTESSAAPAIVLVFCVSYQQVENHLLQPAITSHAVQLNPPIVLVSVLAAAEPGGIGGTRLAIPAADISRILGAGLRPLPAAGRLPTSEDRPSRPRERRQPGPPTGRAPGERPRGGRPAPGSRRPATGRRLTEGQHGSPRSCHLVPVPDPSGIRSRRRSKALLRPLRARRLLRHHQWTFTVFAIQYDSWPTLAWSR